MKQEEIKQFIASKTPDAVLSWMVADATEQEQHVAFEIIMDAALDKLSLPPKPAPTLEPKRPIEA